MRTDKQLVNTIGYAVDAACQYRGHNNKFGGVSFQYTLCDELGLSAINNGNFSLVVDHPYENTKVVKILFGSGRGSNDDNDIYSDGYLDYVVFCQVHAGKDPHLPVIHDARVFNKCAIIVIERLEYAGYGSKDYGRADNFSSFGYHHRARLPALIKEVLDASDCPDMHTKNIMVRSDGQLVVTDPICSPMKNALYNAKTWFVADGRICIDVRMAVKPALPSVMDQVESAFSKIEKQQRADLAKIHLKVQSDIAKEAMAIKNARQSDDKQRGVHRNAIWPINMPWNRKFG